MSRHGMPMHKMYLGPKREPLELPPVKYRPHDNLQFPARPNFGRFEVYAQELFNIQPRSAFTAIIKFGVQIRSGTVFISLKEYLKIKRLSLQDGIISESVDDIVITLQNNSDVVVTINAGDPLCIVGY